MKIDKSKSEFVIKRIRELSGPSGITCPICGNKEWVIGDTIFESREFQNGNIIVGGNSSVMPFLTLTCSNCGYTMLLNAIKYGLIQPDGKEVLEDTQNGK